VACISTRLISVPASKTTTIGGYHGELGIDFNLYFFLPVAEWRYFATEGKILGQTITLDGHTFAAKIGFRF
jgi:hypothetical protein